MNKYDIEFEYTAVGKRKVIAESETAAEDTFFDTIQHEEDIVAPMITKVVELD
jgi:hypothetical protein